jgi:hypothetical protein
MVAAGEGLKQAFGRERPGFYGARRAAAIDPGCFGRADLEKCRERVAPRHETPRTAFI